MDGEIWLMHVYIRLTASSEKEVRDWLEYVADLPYEATVSDITELARIVEDQTKEIDGLIEKVDLLTDELEGATGRAEQAESQVQELLSPSSRRPPPHFKLPDERPSVVHKFKIGANDLGHGYITVGMYPGTSEVGEVFIKMAKPTAASFPISRVADPKISAQMTEMKRHILDLSIFLKGILDQLAISVSIGLQRGIPLEVYVNKFVHTRFPPDGVTEHSVIRNCSSIVDYIFRWLSWRFLEREV